MRFWLDTGPFETKFKETPEIFWYRRIQKRGSKVSLMSWMSSSCSIQKVFWAKLTPSKSENSKNNFLGQHEIFLKKDQNFFCNFFFQVFFILDFSWKFQKLKWFSHFFLLKKISWEETIWSLISFCLTQAKRWSRKLRFL